MTKIYTGITEEKRFAALYACYLPCNKKCLELTCSIGVSYIEKLIDEYGADEIMNAVKLYEAAGIKNPVREFLKAHNRDDFDEYVKRCQEAWS